MDGSSMEKFASHNLSGNRIHHELILEMPEPEVKQISETKTTSH